MIEVVLMCLEEDYMVLNCDDEMMNVSLCVSYDFCCWLIFELGVGCEWKDFNIDLLSYS